MYQDNMEATNKMAITSCTVKLACTTRSIRLNCSSNNCSPSEYVCYSCAARNVRPYPRHAPRLDPGPIDTGDGHLALRQHSSPRRTRWCNTMDAPRMRG